MNDRTGTTETGSGKFRRLLLAGGIFAVGVLIAAGAFFAVRELTSDDGGSSVADTAGTESDRGVGDVLEGRKEAPPVAVADVGALPEGVSPPTLEQLTAEGADNPELEQLSACDEGTFHIRPGERPLCSDGFPYRSLVQWFLCPDGMKYAITSFPGDIDRWPGYPTGQVFSFGGGGSTTTSKHSPQYFFFLPVIYWQEAGQWRHIESEWLMSQTPFRTQNVHANEWSIWRDGRWQNGDEINAAWYRSPEVFGWIETPPSARSSIRRENHPGLETYWFRYYIYWGPITDGAGQTVFNGAWGHHDLGWLTCGRTRGTFIFQ